MHSKKYKHAQYLYSYSWKKGFWTLWFNEYQRLFEAKQNWIQEMQIISLYYHQISIYLFILFISNMI